MTFVGTSQTSVGWTEIMPVTNTKWQTSDYDVEPCVCPEDEQGHYHTPEPWMDPGRTQEPTDSQLIRFDEWVWCYPHSRYEHCTEHCGYKVRELHWRSREEIANAVREGWR